MPGKRRFVPGHRSRAHKMRWKTIGVAARFENGRGGQLFAHATKANAEIAVKSPVSAESVPTERQGSSPLRWLSSDPACWSRKFTGAAMPAPRPRRSTRTKSSPSAFSAGTANRFGGCLNSTATFPCDGAWSRRGLHAASHTPATEAPASANAGIRQLAASIMSCRVPAAGKERLCIRSPIRCALQHLPHEYDCA